MEQIRRRFGLGRTQAYRRLQVLLGYELVRRLALLVGQPALYLAPRRTLRPWAVEHTLLLTELIVDLELAGHAVVGEIEVRRLRHGADPAASHLSSEQAEIILICDRTPDAVAQPPDGGLVAHEIELSSKGRSRRDSILTSYAASDYERVEWIVPRRQLARLILSEVRESGLDGFMRITHGDRLPPWLLRKPLGSSGSVATIRAWPRTSWFVVRRDKPAWRRGWESSTARD